MSVVKLFEWATTFWSESLLWVGQCFGKCGLRLLFMKVSIKIFEKQFWVVSVVYKKKKKKFSHFKLFKPPKNNVLSFECITLG